MVPVVTEKCGDPVVKRLIDNVFDYWRQEFESVPVPTYYPNWLLANSLEDENDELFDRLNLLAQATGAQGEMSEKYDQLVEFQLSIELQMIEQRLNKSDEQYLALTDEWQRLVEIRMFV